MTSTSQTPAYVRTGTPIGAGSILMWLASRVFGIDLSAGDVLVILPLIQGAYYVLGRALEKWKPSLGYVLGIAKQPAYSTENAPAPGPGEEVVAVVVSEEGDGDETPVQTDNGPRPEEGERLSSRQGEVFSGEMR